MSLGQSCLQIVYVIKTEQHTCEWVSPSGESNFAKMLGIADFKALNEWVDYQQMERTEQCHI